MAKLIAGNIEQGIRDNEPEIWELEPGEIILNSEECRILYSELSHHTCSRDHYHEFSTIVRKIAKSAQEKTIENATLQAEDNLGKNKSHSS